MLRSVIVLTVILALSITAYAKEQSSAPSSGNINNYRVVISNYESGEVIKEISYNRTINMSLISIFSSKDSPLPKIGSMQLIRDGIDWSNIFEEILILFPDGVDTDTDGLSDKWEKELGTDPNKEDTDNDGFFDSIEYIIWQDFDLDIDGDGFDNIIDPESYGNGVLDSDNLSLDIPKVFVYNKKNQAIKGGKFFAGLFQGEEPKNNKDNQYIIWLPKCLKTKDKYLVYYGYGEIDDGQEWKASIDQGSSPFESGSSEIILSGMEFDKVFSYSIVPQKQASDCSRAGTLVGVSVELVYPSGRVEKRVVWKTLGFEHVVNPWHRRSSFYTLSDIVVDGVSMGPKKKLKFLFDVPGHHIKFLYKITGT